MLGTKARFNKFQKMFSDHRVIVLEINNKRIF